jgi:hypothetical protein
LVAVTFSALSPFLRSPTNSDPAGAKWQNAKRARDRIPRPKLRAERPLNAQQTQVFKDQRVGTGSDRFPLGNTLIAIEFQPKTSA